METEEIITILESFVEQRSGLKEIFVAYVNEKDLGFGPKRSVRALVRSSS